MVTPSLNIVTTGTNARLLPIEDLEMIQKSRSGIAGTMRPVYLQLHFIPTILRYAENTDCRDAHNVGCQFSISFHFAFFLFLTKFCYGSTTSQTSILSIENHGLGLKWVSRGL